MTEDDDKPTPPYGHKRDADKFTSPIELLIERDLEPEDRKLVERLRYHPTDPYEMIFKATKAEYLRRVDDGSLVSDVEALKRHAGIATWIVRTIVTGALAATAWLAHGIWDRSALEERARMRLENLERIVEEIRQDQRSMRPPASRWTVPSTKDTP